MKVYYESKLAKWLLWPGYSTITFGCFVFTKYSKEEMPTRVLNHEAIHVRQWEEVTIASLIITFLSALFGLPPLWMLTSIVIYYIWYLAEYLMRFIYWIWHGTKDSEYRSAHEAAYYNISFEGEAYANEAITDYLKIRDVFEVLRYIRNIM